MGCTHVQPRLRGDRKRRRLNALLQSKVAKQLLMDMGEGASRAMLTETHIAQAMCEHMRCKVCQVWNSPSDIVRALAQLKDMSCAKIQKVAEAVVEETAGCVSSAVRDLSSMGNSGSCPQNCERDLRRWLHDALGVELELHYITLTLQNTQGPGTVDVQHPVLAPHVVASELWRASPDLFVQHVIGPGGPAAVRSFWKHSMKAEWARKHPAAAQPHMLDWTVPVRLHGDGARFVKGEKLVNLSWSGAMSRGCSWNTRFLFTVVPHSLLVKDITYQQLGKAWSGSR